MSQDKKPRQYNSIAAFRIALEQRLNKHANDEGVNIMRLRRLVAFDRLLARLFYGNDSPWVLKGGYATELRLRGHARSTKDIDLSIPREITASIGISTLDSTLRDLLQQAARIDLGDWFRFRVGEPMMDLGGPPEGGTRFPVAALLDRPFIEFHIDVGLGDLFSPPAEVLRGNDLLSFAGIAPPRVKVLRKEQQFAEKVHAYTYPRQNSRIKDLVDLVLFIEMEKLKPRVTVRCLRETFAHRATHPLPVELMPPPEGWRSGYAELAIECGLRTDTLDKAFETVSRYWAQLPLTSRSRAPRATRKNNMTPDTLVSW
jgi:predicted nucleotidyltransferase component of viral defense system